MDWFATWFDTPYYHILYKNHDYREAEDFISALTSELPLPKESKVIDLACGKGRHSVFLNKLGYEVLGLDLSAQSIAHNKQFENDTLHFRVHDMRQAIGGEKADAVFNLFTSFGYFDDEADDKKVFRSVSDILKPGGIFILDYLNQEMVRNSLVGDTVVEREGIEFKINKKIEDNFVIKNIEFSDEGHNFSYFERVKLHTPETIAGYAAEAGFEVIKLWGNYDLSDFDEELSPRCINYFRKI